MNDGEQAPSSPAGGDAGRDAAVAKLARSFRRLATEDAPGTSPLYAALAGRIAEDPEVASVLLAAPPVQRRPALLLAAVHLLVLREPELPLARYYSPAGLDAGDAADAWERFRASVLDRRAEIEHIVATHSLQTNEVGRSGVVLPALAEVAAGPAAGRPLWLVDLGASAGLNLLVDRMRVCYRAPGVEPGGPPIERCAGPSGAAVRLDVALRGDGIPPVPPGGVLAVAGRLGIDLDPVDVSDPEAARWLAACVWPDAPGRPQRLAAALDEARRDPPRVVAGDYVHDLGRLVGEVDPDAYLCLLTTWSLWYLGASQRAALAGAVEALARTRPLSWVTLEAPGGAPGVPDPPWSIDERGLVESSVVGLVHAEPARGGVLEGAVRARAHAHGLWLAWLDG